jgi:hypothetical protein
MPGKLSIIPLSRVLWLRDPPRLVTSSPIAQSVWEESEKQNSRYKSHWVGESKQFVRVRTTKKKESSPNRRVDAYHLLFLVMRADQVMSEFVCHSHVPIAVTLSTAALIREKVESMEEAEIKVQGTATAVKGNGSPRRVVVNGHASQPVAIDNAESL